MNVFLDRTKLSVNETFGTMRTESSFLCFTIERPWLDNQSKISCIPVGTYSVQKYISPKHGEVWEVMNVPNRYNIEIHPANFASQLLGCIAPGSSMGEINGVPAVLNSQNTFKALKKALPDNFTLIVSQTMK